MPSLDTPAPLWRQPDSPLNHQYRGIVTLVTYDQVISDVVKVVEAIGATIMVVGGLFALVDYAVSMLRKTVRHDAYQQLRQRLGRAILLGLEILIVGDIVRTIIVDPTINSVAVLGIIVIIRIVLGFSLKVEIDGVWPWDQWRLGQYERWRSTDHFVKGIRQFRFQTKHILDVAGTSR